MTEQQSNKPITAAEAFEAAGENLRLAEVGWSDTRVPTDRVALVIDIANAWTAPGVGLTDAEPFDAKYPIPIRLVGEPLEPVIGTMQEFDLRGHTACPNGPDCTDCRLDRERGPGWENATTHVHDRMCYHTWVAPMEPCAKGCGTRPEMHRTGPSIPGYCSAACPDVTA